MLVANEKQMINHANTIGRERGRERERERGRAVVSHNENIYTAYSLIFQ